MRAATLRVLLGVCALVAGILLASHSGTDDAEPQDIGVFEVTPAQAAVGTIEVQQITCKPFNLSDGGVGTLVNCGTGYNTVKAQNRTTVPVYIGGGTAFTPAQYSYGQQHCSGCADGAAFTGDVYHRKLYCISGTADAGVVIQVICGR